MTTHLTWLWTSQRAQLQGRSTWWGTWHLQVSRSHQTEWSLETSTTLKLCSRPLNLHLVRFRQYFFFSIIGTLVVLCPKMSQHGNGKWGKDCHYSWYLQTAPLIQSSYEELVFIQLQKQFKDYRSITMSAWENKLFRSIVLFCITPYSLIRQQSMWYTGLPVWPCWSRQHVWGALT